MDETWRGRSDAGQCADWDEWTPILLTAPRTRYEPNRPILRPRAALRHDRNARIGGRRLPDPAEHRAVHLASALRRPRPPPASAPRTGSTSACSPPSPTCSNPIAMAWDTPRPALDRRELHVCRDGRTVRPPPPRPRADLRGRRRRRPGRPPHGLHRRRAAARQRRARPRRRLAALPAAVAVRPRPQRRRRARRPRRGRARRLHGRRREPSHVRQRPATGGPTAGSTGVAGPRRPARSASRARPTRIASRFAAALWRYHPIRKRFEILAHGTTNPWGHDWNALGEAFFINTVNGHLWHLIPGLALRPPAHDRAEPAGLCADRPARRPLALGQLAGR